MSPQQEWRRVFPCLRGGAAADQGETDCCPSRTMADRLLGTAADVELIALR
jgi:hypothetical protein